MNFKTTYILFGVLLGVVALFALAIVLNPAKPTEESWVLPSLHNSTEPVASKDIDTVEIQRNSPAGEHIVFVRDKDIDRWRMTEPFELPSHRVDKSAVDGLVSEVLDAKQEEKSDVGGDLKQWGLDNPDVVVTIKKGDKEWKINLGKKVETTGGQTSVVYVSSSDRKEPVAVRLSSLNDGFKDVNDFRDKNLLADNSSEIQSVSLQDGKHDPVVLQHEEGTGNRWKIAQPNYGEADYDGAPAGTQPGGQSQPGVRSLLDLLAQLKVEYKSDKENDFVPRDGADLAKYGLEPGAKPGRLRIEVKRSLSSGFGADKKEKSVTETLLAGNKVDDKGGKYYAMLEGEKHVVKVAANFDPVTKVIDNPSSLRDRDLVHLDTFRTDAVAIKNAAGSVELFKPESATGWKLFRDPKAEKGENAEGDAVTKLLDALNTKRQVKDFPDPKDPKADDKALGLDQPAAVVEIWVDGIQKEEKKKDDKSDAEKKDTGKEEKKEEPKKDPNARPKLKSDTPTVKLTFGKHEGDKVYVRRESSEDKASVVVAVPDTLLAKVTEGPLAYLDRTLPTFTGDATALTLERGGQTFKLEKEKDKGAWKLTEPKELAGRPANSVTVSDIVFDLKSLRAEKLVAEKATPELDEKYGLKSPRVKATVVVNGKDNKPEEHTYLFGDEVKDDKGTVTGVYAKEAKSGLVFTVAKHVLDTLQGELRDPVVFHLGELAKVKGMKLIGWQGVLGAPGTLELERKSGTDWAMGKGSSLNFDVDATKAEEFLKGLADLRVVQFLDPKTGPKPEKMDVKEDALEVQVTVEGEKDPFTIMVGGEAPDKKNYFAASNRLPGDSFLVAKETFEKARGKPAYFKK
jgi:hypothetical protein